MKNLTLLFIGITIVLSGMAQQPLHADAGEDKHFCPFDVDHDSLYRTVGGTPTAWGGTAPYTYRWFLKEPVTYLSAIWHASDFLSDTTISNPLFISAPAFPSHQLFIEVVDSSGAKVVDTLTYTKSHFIVLLNQAYTYVDDGDTLEIHGSSFDSSFPVVDHFWHDSVGFIDPTSDLTPRVICHYDSTPIEYLITYYDTFSCPLTVPSYELIYVSPVGLERPIIKPEIDALSPNPVKRNEPLKVHREARILSLTALNGQSISLPDSKDFIFINSPGSFVVTYKMYDRIFTQNIIVIQ